MRKPVRIDDRSRHVAASPSASFARPSQSGAESRFGLHALVCHHLREADHRSPRVALQPRLAEDVDRLADAGVRRPGVVDLGRVEADLDLDERDQARRRGGAGELPRVFEVASRARPVAGRPRRHRALEGELGPQIDPLARVEELLLGRVGIVAEPGGGGAPFGAREAGLDDPRARRDARRDGVDLLAGRGEVSVRACVVVPRDRPVGERDLDPRHPRPIPRPRRFASRRGEDRLSRRVAAAREHHRREPRGARRSLLWRGLGERSEGVVDPMGSPRGPRCFFGRRRAHSTVHLTTPPRTAAQISARARATGARSRAGA